MIQPHWYSTFTSHALAPPLPHPPPPAQAALFTSPSELKVVVYGRIPEPSITNKIKTLHGNRYEV